MSAPASPRPRRPLFDDRFGDDDDPAAGLVNLFDLWMVFAFALLLMLANSALDASSTSADAPVDPSHPQLPDPMRASGRELDGQGTRLGTAYRLASGSIVYVPDTAEHAAGPR
ncbi:MAG: DUF2149 domain-containing protein [Planctomycetota bacterium]